MKRYPLVSFFVMTFAITWGLAGMYFVFPRFFESLLGPISSSNPMFILAVWGPTISGFILTAVASGKRGVKGLLKRFIPGRVSAWWYLLAGVAVLGALALMVLITGEQMPILTMAPSSLFMVFLINLVTGPLGEEFGWRGFALPRLLERFKPLSASVLLGAIWGLWHLPSFMMSGSPQNGLQLPAFMVTAVCLSAISTWMFIHVKQSIFFGFLFHYTVNLGLSLINGSLVHIGLLTTATVILLVILTGKDLGKSPGLSSSMDDSQQIAPAIR